MPENNPLFTDVAAAAPVDEAAVDAAAGAAATAESAVDAAAGAVATTEPAVDTAAAGAVADAAGTDSAGETTANTVVSAAATGDSAVAAAKSPFVENYKAAKNEAKAAHSAYNKAVHNKQAAVKKAERQLQDANEQKTKYRAKLEDVTLYIDRVAYKGTDYPLTPDIEVTIGSVRAGGDVSEVSSGGTTTISASDSSVQQQASGDPSQQKTADDQHISMTVKTQGGSFCAVYKAGKETAVRKLAADIVAAGINAQANIAAADEAIKKAQDNLGAVNEDDYGVTDAKTLDDQKAATFSSLKEGMSEQDKLELTQAKQQTAKEIGIVVAILVVILLIVWAVMAFSS